MSNTRVKIFSFNSCKTFSKEMEDEVNAFLERPDIIVDPADVEFIPDEYTTFKVVYTLRKTTNKNKK